MPQLPVISAEPNVQVPETVGIQRVNLARPNPALEAVHEGADEVTNKALQLHDFLRKQQISTDLLNSESSFITQTANLDRTTSTIVDPDKRLQAQTSGANDIVSGIIKNNPSIAPQIEANLNVRRSEYLRQAGLSYVSSKLEVGKADIDASYKNSLIAIGNSTNPQEELQAKNDFYQHIDHSVENRLLTPAEGITYKSHFAYDAQKSHFDALLATPAGYNQILNMSLKDSGLTPADFNDYVAKAVTEGHREHEIDNTNSIINTQQQHADFYAGKTNYDQDLDLYRRRIINDNDFNGKYGHPPEDFNLRQNLKTQFDNWTGTGTELEEQIRNNISGNYNMFGPDRSWALNYGEQKVKELNTDSGKFSAQVKGDLRHYAVTTYPMLFAPNPFGSAVPLGAKAVIRRKEAANIITTANSLIDKATSQKEKLKYQEEAETKLDALMSKPEQPLSKFIVGGAPKTLGAAEIRAEDTTGGKW